MPSRLNPYLNFPGNTKDAMEFYKSVFGGTLTMNTFGEYGEQDPDRAGKIMHAMLETDQGFTLMASDPPPGMDVQVGTNMAISLSGDDAESLRGYWDKLSAEGNIQMPFEKQMWGDTFGMCTDKFGLPWMVNITESS